MVWFNVDDGLSTSPKILAIPRAQRLEAVGLWTLAGSWCGKHLTDGAVPAFMLDEWGATVELAQILVEVGLWRSTSRGYRFHSWEDYQQSRSDVEAKRERDRKRKQAYREKIAGQAESGPSGTSVGQDAGLQAESSPPIPTLPYPSLPSPTHPIKSSSSPRGDGGAFAAFYMAYPRKVGKEAARKAFEKAARTTSPQVIIDGAKRFAADPNLPEKQFIAHPATWLNAGRWEDEPMPPRDGRPQYPDVDPGDEWLRDRS